VKSATGCYNIINCIVFDVVHGRYEIMNQNKDFVRHIVDQENGGPCVTICFL
jgi:hypothetical protein